MKKILTAITATAILGTSLLANTGNLEVDKRVICDLLTKENIIDTVILNETLRKFYNAYEASETDKVIKTSIIMGTVEGTANAMKKINGDLSIDFLKNIGVGANTKLTWENIIWNYYNFNLKLYVNEDKRTTELLTFLNTIYNEENQQAETKREFSDKYNSGLFIYNTKDLEFITFIKYLDYNNKKFNEFFKYLALKDYEKAYDFIKKINEEAKTAETQQALINACDNEYTQKFIDLIVFEDTEGDIEQEIIKDKNGYVDYLYIKIKKQETEKMTYSYTEGFIESYKPRMMQNCYQSEEVYNEELNINMKVVIIDEDKKEYGRFEINKNTCEKWKTEN